MQFQVEPSQRVQKPCLSDPPVQNSEAWLTDLILYAHFAMQVVHIAHVPGED